MIEQNHSDLIEILKSRFGHDSFRPMQEEIVRHVLRKDHCLVLMPSGAGKSICYQLPAMVFDGLTLVVSPLISLMKDQVDDLNANGIPAAFINSSLLYEEYQPIYKAVSDGRVKILYVAPERLAMESFRTYLAAQSVSLMAVDEAHCISEWGHDFREDYRSQLKSIRVRFPDVPCIALTSTATEHVQEDILDQLNIPKARTFVSSLDRENLTYIVQPKRRRRALIRLLDQHKGESAIVYCSTKEGTEDLAAHLSQEGFSALAYHAGLDDDERRLNQERFIRDDVHIVVATIAFGMGVDKPDVRLVVHYNLPKSLEGYYQETGRAGRDGLPSECVLFYSPVDRRTQAYWIDRNRNKDPAEQARAWERLDRMVEYCEQIHCRRAFLLRYFGERTEGQNCGGCDVCLAEWEEFDATVIAHNILSAVRDTGQRFGIAHVADVLRGSRSQKVIGVGHDRLSVYGIVRDFSKDDIRTIAIQLIDKRLLVKAEGRYPTLAVTALGREFLRSGDVIRLRRKHERTDGMDGTRNPPLDYDPGLFEALRKLRWRLAEERGVPPYFVFGDTSLREMAHYAPMSKESFARITGVGEVKLEQYGDIFLRCIRAYAQGHGLEESRRPSEDPSRPRGVRAPGSSYFQTLDLFRQGLSPDEIAARRGLTLGTIVGHLERLAAYGEDIDVRHLFDQSRFDRIAREFERAETPWQLSEVKNALGDDYSYEEIRLVRLSLRQDGQCAESDALH